MRSNEANWEMIRFDNTGDSNETSLVAVEMPITIHINGSEFATMVCSPSNLKELLIGFLASEGIIRSYSAIKDLAIDIDTGYAYIEIDHLPTTFHQDHSKRFIGSCCGKSRQFYFKNDVKTAKTILSKHMISAKQCFYLMHELQQSSSQFRKTGGVHNAALATTNELMVVRTDIGRHNALDKLFGHILVNNVPVHDKIIVFSGRISSEVLLKLSKMGIGILISKSAPTNLALQLAEDLKITVIGFVRGYQMNVYTHPERIVRGT
ncbi:MAG: formate dehydrogenase accessory sulfurtransferase FdhD [Bacillota bacterium]|uniref:Sulfur carrier protein FdhD n=2 Tax=Virgibacillus TaxID=84406 RepID=A0A941ID40_9BACI|nr:formate dehydrogenase accessory sulfurtransferase FdhD [Virgibacillus salarius]NAZ10726.1 formate dehydrogenase accessory sulfurtransferase FdhD [Agaribacter marinus]